MENKTEVKKEVKVEAKKEVKPDIKKDVKTDGKAVGKEVKPESKPVATKGAKKIVVPVSRRGRIRELLKSGKSYNETYDTIIKEFKGARAEIVKLQVKMNCKELGVVVP